MKLNLPETNGGWKKYEGNPVLGNEEIGTCFDVLVLENGQGYDMHLSWRPKKALAVSRSTDGISWSDPEIYMNHDPECGWMDNLNRHCVLWHDGKWHMWFTGQARGYSWIGYATSDDGMHWKRVSDQPVLYSERPFEGPSVMCPFVMWDEEMQLYRMWYAAGEQYEPNVLAYATSKDGIHWDKLPANPIFVGFKDQAYEKDRVGPCQIVRADGWYYMFYVGFRNEDSATIHLARSRDGIQDWQRFDKNPIVWQKPWGKSFDRDACYKHSVLPMGDGWMLWYNGRCDIEESIGAVMHPGFDLGFGPDEE